MSPAPVRAFSAAASLAMIAIAVSACANNSAATVPSNGESSNQVPIDKAPGPVQSLAEFCAAKHLATLPNGQMSLDAACAAPFVAGHKDATVKTVEPAGTVVLLFPKPIKVDDICGQSSFKAPMCRGFRPGDQMPAIPLSF
jgi:hypothetical protein